MTGLRNNLRVMFAVVLAYLINKLLLRPYVLESDSSDLLNIFVLSLPNLCEAILGSILLTNIGLVINRRVLGKDSKIAEGSIYLISAGIAGVYVILQELKIHNLGGNNVYDIYDLLFSIIGLVLAYLFLIFSKPKFVVTD